VKPAKVLIKENNEIAATSREIAGSSPSLAAWGDNAQFNFRWLAHLGLHTSCVPFLKSETKLSKINRSARVQQQIPAFWARLTLNR